MFSSTKLHNLEISTSVHAPILMELVPTAGYHFSKQFRFENAWLREPLYFQVIKDSWELCGNDEVMNKVSFCGQQLCVWGKEFTARKNLFEAYIELEVFWRQRSKQLWLQEGDNNSKFFHASATNRRWYNFVTKLKDQSGAGVDWNSGLDLLMRKVTRSVQSRVSFEQNAELLLPVSEEEVRKALFQMHPDKSLGPDGITVKHPMDMGDLRPIGLCNVLHKIVSKVVANRLKNVMPTVISDTQSVFLQGRLISDNIMIAYEIMHHLKRKRRGRDCYMALKLDVSKAYDKLEWGYLRAKMERMGFDGRWINLVMQCVCSVSYTILHGFSSLLRSYEQSCSLTGCKIARGAPIISHILFADDSYIYCKATKDESHNVKELLHTYEVVLGQRINFTKSSVFLSNNTNCDLQDAICVSLEIYEAHENGYYLGLPCSVGRNKNAILGFLKDKLHKRIQGWEGRILSCAGKEVLLKSIAQALPNYAMNVFLLLLETCKELSRLMAKFW
ncbi:uncharacterized protein LOC115720145 [Cannabis sativa]|uniref:uncharacterized protein LOC115720145 n=1 Tax=Cannabis sativa TaxID=3483 RepID=UPI0029C9CD1A|nr:uncharacterized protein LOC115720145 [Cannabis sativa]